MSKAHTTTLYKKERTRVLFAVSALVLMFGMYIYFICASVVHVVMREELNQDITEMNSQVSQLESQYIAAQHEVSADIASHSGYIAVSEKVFIDRAPTSLVLSRNNES